MGTLLVRRYEKMVRVVYQHYRKYWEHFKALLVIAETVTLTKIAPMPPSYEDAQGDKEVQGLDKQNLDGFDVQDDSKRAGLDRHAELNELANWLSDLYGERPVIPYWATAERSCPNYY